VWKRVLAAVKEIQSLEPREGEAVNYPLFRRCVNLVERLQQQRYFR